MEKALEAAAAAIRRGNIVIYPTETFFAAGCDAMNEAAIKRVYTLKKRPHGMPLPLILGAADQLSLAADISSALKEDVRRLAGLWPAPLTLLLPVCSALPSLLTAGTGKIAVRVSPHAAAQALAIQCGTPIISTSANISGRPAVTRACELDGGLLQRMDPADFVLDLPPVPSGGAPSSIVEPLGGGRVSVRRPGAFDMGALVRLGFKIIQEGA